MNFRVVEGEESISFPYFDEFCDDFFNPNLYVKDLLQKYKLSRNEYNRLRKKIVEKYHIETKPTKFHPSPNNPENMTYIHKHNVDKFAVIKLINGKKVYYGAYDTVEIAQKIRDKLIECDWDKSKLKQIKSEVLGEL